MKVVVGLGNPGSEYTGTRHNVGFAVVDSLAQGPRASRFKTQFQALVAESAEDAGKLLLVKPQTFMNLSGLCVRQLLEFYKLPTEDLLVVCDDINLPLGKLRLRANGSHGGHNGLRNIQQHLATNEYSRLRIGVDAPKQEGTVGHVLGRFRASELPVISEAVAKSVEAVVFWLGKGTEATMNRYNG